MSWINNFLEKLFPTKESVGGNPAPIVIDIPASLYYKELAVYTASSLIGNAISRSEIKHLERGKAVKDKDYFILNVSPNPNETSSVFWHKVINRVIRQNKALVIEVNENLYCADSFTVEKENVIHGNIYSGVTVDNFQFSKKFDNSNSYLFRMDDINVNQLINGMYDEYGKILSVAAKKFNNVNGQKYKLHIEGVKAGDEEFNKTFKEYIQEQLESYLKSDNAVYPEFDGYELKADESVNGGNANDYLALKNDLFSTVAGIFHIPESMMKGNITNMKEIITGFLTFGVDPYADMIAEVLNKGAGVKNFTEGNYYSIDTGRINHHDIFEIASNFYNLIGSSAYNVDQLREKLGDEPLNTDWSKKHFISKNFQEINEFLSTSKGGEG